MPLSEEYQEESSTTLIRKVYRNNYQESFENGTEVTAELLKEKGIISKVNDGIVVLGTGNLTKKLTVKAARFTKTASEKIEALGGKAEVI